MITRAAIAKYEKWFCMKNDEHYRVDTEGNKNFNFGLSVYI